LARWRVSSTSRTRSSSTRLPDDILEGFYGGKEGLEAVDKLVQEEAERHKGKKD
jgi:hypothetical protein